MIYRIAKITSAPIGLEPDSWFQVAYYSRVQLLKDIAMFPFVLVGLHFPKGDDLPLGWQWCGTFDALYGFRCDTFDSELQAKAFVDKQAKQKRTVLFI